MNIKKIIKEEIETYDDILQLKNWYEEEKNKLESIKDFKEWKLKSKRLQKQYFTKSAELTKGKNPFGLKGDLDANFIYHYTKGDNLISMIEDDMMIGSGDGISFSSHPNLYKRGFTFWHPNEYSKGTHHNNTGVKLKFNFNEMKQDGLKFIAGNENIGTHSGENEIRLMADELINPLKYIDDIIIFKNKENDYLNLIDFLNSNNINYKLI